MPSPRCSHSGWEYKGNLWTFGGYGVNGCNNEVFNFCPSTTDWTNPKCSGQVPPPTQRQATTVNWNKVWLYGGQVAGMNADFYQLDMKSLTWTVIKTDQPEPQGRVRCSLTAITDNKLVLHGGQKLGKVLSDTWIFDLESQSWQQHARNEDHPRVGHRGSLGLDNNVIIIGGVSKGHKPPTNTTFCVTLTPGPNSLQKQALQTIYWHKAEVQWKFLPKQLIYLLGFDENTEDKISPRKQIPKQNSQNKNDRKIG